MLGPQNMRAFLFTLALIFCKQKERFLFQISYTSPMYYIKLSIKYIAKLFIFLFFNELYFLLSIPPKPARSYPRHARTLNIVIFMQVQTLIAFKHCNARL